MSETDRAVRRAVTRGKVTNARTRAGRVLVDMTLLDGEVRRNVELMLPTGMSALPAEGSDLVVLEVGGNRDHLVAMVADDPASRIEGLAAGEMGMRAFGQQVIIRADGVEIVDALKITITSSGPIDITAAGTITLDAPRINLGAGAALGVKRSDDSPSSKVFAA